MGQWWNGVTGVMWLSTMKDHSGRRARKFHLFCRCSNTLAFQQHGQQLRHARYSCKDWLWTYRQMAHKTSVDGSSYGACVPACPCGTLHWCHNGRDNVSNHQPHDCLLNCLFRRRSKKTSKLRVTGLCVGNSPGTGEFPAQMASNAENVSIWWRHHEQWSGVSQGVWMSQAIFSCY